MKTSSLIGLIACGMLVVSVVAIGLKPVPQPEAKTERTYAEYLRAEHPLVSKFDFGSNLHKGSVTEGPVVIEKSPFCVIRVNVKRVDGSANEFGAIINCVEQVVVGQVVQLYPMEMFLNDMTTRKQVLLATKI